MNVLTFVFASIVPLYFMLRTNSIFGAHRVKSFIASVAGLWTALYAGIVPCGIFLLGHEDPDLVAYYQISAIILVASYYVLILLLIKFKIRDIEIVGSSYVNTYAFLAATALVILVLPNFFLTPHLRIFISLPGVVVLYVLSDNGVKLFATAVAHIVTLYHTFQAGILIDSKEAAVIYSIGPILFSFIFKFNGIRLKGLFTIILISIFASFFFIAAQPIVTLSRLDRSINLIELILSIPENFQIFAEASLRRVFVLDALARTLENEFQPAPIRPSQPVWTLTGWVFSIFPEIFPRPFHAREALEMSGYSTSHPDVNIAITYVGSIIWSYSLIGSVPALFLFWLIFLCILKLGCRWPPVLSSFFLFSAGFSVLRLERLADVVLSNLFMALVLTSVLSFFAFGLRTIGARRHRKVSNV